MSGIFVQGHDISEQRRAQEELRRYREHLEELVRERALGEDIELETIIGGGLWNTLVDANQLENVILNLAINARDAMQRTGRLTVEAGNAMLDDR